MIDGSNSEKITSSFDEIRVSLDGYNAEMHDYHRGSGSFEKTTKAISLLEKSGARIRIAMTVTKKNVNDIELMAKKYGNKLIFQPLFNAGNAKNRNMAITGEEYYYALKKAKGVEPYAKIAPKLMQLKNKGITKCAIGEGEISISHSGDVYPCHMLHLPEYYAGNIREKRIVEIYETSTVLSKTRNLSVLTRKTCKECPVRLLCSGSCRARALYLANDLDAADSFCEYEFLAFTEGLFSSSELTSPDADCQTECNCGNVKC
jgi:radical SAM protein with 4Fe4S-binding SPASM domain